MKTEIAISADAVNKALPILRQMRDEGVKAGDPNMFALGEVIEALEEADRIVIAPMENTDDE